jgi:hypothetical protein
VKSSSTSTALNCKSAKVLAVSATSTKNKLANNTDPSLLQKSKRDALTVKLNPPNVKPNPLTVKPNPLTVNPNPLTVKPDPLTVKPNPLTVMPNPLTVKPNPLTAKPNPLTVELNPLTVKPNSGDVQMLNPLDNTISPNTINENDFKV